MSRPSRIAIVKELGSRTPRCLAAHAIRKDEEPELVVVERYPAVLGPEVLQTIEDEAKELVAFEHANVATLIWTVKLKGDVAIMSEWVDGESVATILASDQKPSFEVLLRVMSDVLEAMSALHGQGTRVCGALATDDVFVGVDGVTRITRFGLGLVPPGALGARRIATMAPEFMRGERSARGDVFTAGTFLWECFMGAPLYETPANVDAQKEKLANAAPAIDASKREAWAAGLADVIARALSIDPNARYEKISDLASAMLNAVPGKMGSRAAVSQYVAKVFGERIEARLVKLEPKVDVSFSVGAPPMSVPPAEPTPPPPLAKLPEIEAPKLQPPKFETTPKPKPVDAVRAEPLKPVMLSKDAAKEAAKPFIRKETAKEPAKEPAREIAKELPKKAVPLPKRSSDTDSSPNLVAAAAKVLPTPAMPAASPVKTNGVKAEKIVAKTPNVIAPIPNPKPPIAASIVAEQEVEDVPPSGELDSDIDLVSVRPPPIAKNPIAIAKQEEAPAPRAVPPPPPAEDDDEEEEKKVVVVPAVAAVPKVVTPRDSEINVYAKRSAYRGPLAFFVGLGLTAAGFALGRYTAPDTWPPTPTFSATVTATTSHAPEHAAPPTGNPSQAAPPNGNPSGNPTTSAQTGARTNSPPVIMVAPQTGVDAGKGDGGPRYDPNGI